MATHGAGYLRDVEGRGTIALSNGQVATVEWSEAQQGFVATHYTDPPPAAGGQCTLTSDVTGQCLAKTTQVEEHFGVVTNWEVQRFPTHLVITITLLAGKNFSLDDPDLVIRVPAWGESFWYLHGLRWRVQSPETGDLISFGDYWVAHRWLTQGVPVVTEVRHTFPYPSCPNSPYTTWCPPEAMDWMQPFEVYYAGTESVILTFD